MPDNSEHLDEQGITDLDEQEPVVNPRRSPAGDHWRLLFFGSVAALLVVLSFGTGMISERVLFAGGGLLDRSRSDDPAALSPAGSVEEQYPLTPRSRPSWRTSFSSGPTTMTQWPKRRSLPKLSKEHWLEIAAAAATPVASIDDVQRQLDYGAARRRDVRATSNDYSVFFEPVEQEPLAEALEGEYEGIGVWVDHPEGTFTVIVRFPDSPAEEAGLLPGDVILKADGAELTGMEDDQALNLIRGPSGTSVTLTIKRVDTPDPVWSRSSGGKFRFRT